AVVALGLAIVSRNPQATKGLSRFFLGDILLLNNSDIYILAALLLTTCVFMVFFFNHLNLINLSPILARSRNPLKTSVSPYIFGAFLALVIMISIWAVGVLLVTALLVAPAAAARNWAGSLASMFRLAVIISLISGQVGLYLSTRPQINTSTGATVVLVSIFIFMVSFITRRRN
ncbi:MAG: metal ABC transporter permease, partial [Candidatus Adiutrix sp.]